MNKIIKETPRSVLIYKFRRFLSKKRKDIGYTQAEVACMFGTSLQDIQNFEYNKIKSFDYTVYYSLLFIFDDYLLFRDLLGMPEKNKVKVIAETCRQIRIQSKTMVYDLANEYNLPNSLFYLFEEKIVADEYIYIIYLLHFIIKEI